MINYYYDIFHLYITDMFMSEQFLYEAGHEKMCLMSYANNKGADQPAHLDSLISAFVVRCLDSVMSLVSVTKISNLRLASVAEQAGLSLTWSETPKDTFSHDEAHMHCYTSSWCCVQFGSGDWFETLTIH